MSDDLFYQFVLMSDRSLIALLGGLTDPVALSGLQRLVLAEINRRCLDHDIDEALIHNSAAA